MFSAIRKRLEEHEDGFTLIELLVVVIIIGILAAIAIPTFLNQRERGWEADAQSTLRNAAIAAESCAVAEGGNYLAACPDTASLQAEGFNLTDDQVANFTYTPTATGYTMSAQHASGGRQFVLDSADGQVQPAAAAPAA